MTEHQAKIIVALADNNLKVSETARALFMHRNTVQYHIDKIRRETKLNPLWFHDMCELLPLAQWTLIKEGK